MYAIVETGGKQYRVSAGDIIDVELLDAKRSVTLDKVLLFSDGDKIEIGTPYVKGVKVAAKVLGDVRGPKVTTFKYKNKINYHRTKGHRQSLLQLEITEVKHGA